MTKLNELYSKEIEKISLLSMEEEKALAVKAFAGDKTAQKKLVEANLRFVVKIASKYKDYMDINDLVAEGNIGLMKAAEKFDPSTGNRFSTYAVWWIRAYVQKAIRELSKGIKFPANKYEEMKQNKWVIVSLDKPVMGKDGESVPFGTLLEDDRIKNPEDKYIEKEMQNQLRELVENLNDKEKAIITMRYGLNGKEPMSLSQVGTALGYTKERIRQIEKKALCELRTSAITEMDMCFDMAA